MNMPDPIENWHLKKEVNISHILTTLSMIIGAFWYIQTNNERLTRLEASFEAFQATHSRAVVVIEDRFDRIENKLDKLIDNVGRTRNGVNSYGR